jgi:hypothetical protein
VSRCCCWRRGVVPAFDALLASEKIKVILTSVRTPNANAHMERWVGSVRRECLDRLLIVGRRQLEHVRRGSGVRDGRRGFGHRGSGFGPVAVTSCCGTQSSAWVKPSKRAPSRMTPSYKERTLELLAS